MSKSKARSEPEGIKQHVCPNPRRREGCLVAVVLKVTLSGTFPVPVALLSPCPSLPGVGGKAAEASGGQISRSWSHGCKCQHEALSPEALPLSTG